jgi:hypothetical protein
MTTARDATLGGIAFLHPYVPFPGDRRKIEEQLGRPAELTPLGRKLLGLDSWQ